MISLSDDASTRVLPCIMLCAEPLLHYLHNPHDHLLGRQCCYFYFTNGETEA